jgi:hypothetical protein
MPKKMSLVIVIDVPDDVGDDFHSFVNELDIRVTHTSPINGRKTGQLYTENGGLAGYDAPFESEN